MGDLNVLCSSHYISCAISDIGECASNPCLHGNCLNLVNGWSCDCDDGYDHDNDTADGDRCERGIHADTLVKYQILCVIGL